MKNFHDENEEELTDLGKTISKKKKSYSRAKRITIDDSQGVSKADLNYLRGQIRQAFIRSDYRSSFLASKKLSKPRFKKDKSRHKVDRVYYICEQSNGHGCGGEFSANQIEVDHIEEVSDVGVFDLDNCREWIKALYCPWENLQVLCVECHSKKTNKQYPSI